MKVVGTGQDNEGCIDPASWVKSSWAKGIGGFRPRSGKNRCALRVLARYSFSCVGQVGLRNFYLELLQLMIVVKFFLDYGSEHLRTTSENSSEDDEEGCKASGR